MFYFVICTIKLRLSQFLDLPPCALAQIVKATLCSDVRSKYCNHGLCGCQLEVCNNNFRQWRKASCLFEPKVVSSTNKIEHDWKRSFCCDMHFAEMACNCIWRAHNHIFGSQSVGFYGGMCTKKCSVNTLGISALSVSNWIAVQKRHP